MNANEIIVGKDYIIKIAHNSVKVKVLSHSGHSWIVKTAGGKIMPVQMADRFVRAVDHTPETVTILVPAESQEPQTPEPETATGPIIPAAPAPVPSTVPTEPVTPQAAIQVPPPGTSTPTATEKKLSMLDAAAKVLETATAPMTAKEILSAMEEAGLWKPGKGLTPDRTILAGIFTEIKRKLHPRFRKTAPGTFEYIGGANHD